jgi:periplasmic protein TonB
MLRWISLIAVLIAFSTPVKAQNDPPEEWRKQIVIRLSSSKRFPPEALGQAGTTKVGFVLDRYGRLVSHWLMESTGNRALDEESLAIVERAQPFPIPPPDLEEHRLTLAVPIIFDDEWRKQVIARVISNKRYPPGGLGQTGSATVFFVLDRRGRLVSHWLTESTGHRALDEESLAIVERAQPFPAPPPNLEEDRLRLAIGFDYRLPPGQSGSWEQEQARLRAKVNSICRGC